MWIGNLMLLVLNNLPLVGLWVRLLAVPYRLLFVVPASPSCSVPALMVVPPICALSLVKMVVPENALTARLRLICGACRVV
jgi:TctA family transporter